MHTSIALLRGINVGGRNKLPMKELVRDLESLKLRDIQSYIQSGNVVFHTSGKPAASLGKRIAELIHKQHGFRPDVLILTADHLRKAIEANPFPQAASNPKSLHLFFLASIPKAPDIDSLNAIKARTEHFKLLNDVFYLHAPDGIARSKLAANVEKHLGLSATARNWRTVQKLAEMANTD